MDLRPHNMVERQLRPLSGRWESWVKIFLLLFVFLGSRAQAQVPTPSGLTALPGNGAVTLEWTPIPSLSPTAYFIYRVLCDDTPTLTPTPTVTLNSTTSLTNTPTYPTYTPTETCTDTPTLAPIATVGPATPPIYTDYQVTNGRSYLYQVAAMDITLGSPAAITIVPYSLPEPVQVTVQNLHSGALDLFWGIPLSTYPVSIYQVFRCFVATSPTATIGTPVKASPTFTPTSVAVSVVLSTTPNPIATTSETSYSDILTPAPGVYFYVVQAVDVQSNPGLLPTYATGPATLLINLTPHPPILTGYVPVTPTPTYGVQLYWNGPLASEGVTEYEVDVLVNQTPTAIATLTTLSPTMSYLDASITETNNSSNFTTYQVKAYNNYGSSGSNVIQAYILKSNVPGGNFQVTPVATANAVTLSWNDGMPGTYGLGGYWVFKGLYGYSGLTGTPTPYASILATTTPTPVFVDTPIVNHMGYWVQPFDNAPIPVGGSVATSTPVYLNLAPTPVSTVSAATVAGRNNQISVSWSGNTGPSFFGAPADYVIYRFYPTPTQTPTLSIIATVGFSQNNYTDFVAGATPGSQVEYQVGVVDALGNTSDLTTLSNPVTTNSSLGLPLKPAVLPLAGSSNTLVYSWLQNPLSDQVDNYYLFGSDWPTLTTTPTPVTIIPATATPSPTLFYSSSGSNWNASFNYLLAHNSVGYSSATTLSGIPVPAYSVSAAPTTGQQVMVSWNLTPTPNLTPGVDAFEVYRSGISGSDFTPVATVPVTQSYFIDTNVQPANSYFYRVTARADGPAGELAESPIYPTPVAEAGLFTWPSIPVGLIAQGGVDQTILYWGFNPSADNVESYLIYNNGTLTPILTVMATILPTSTFTPSSPTSTPTITPTTNLVTLITPTQTNTPSPTSTGYYISLPATPGLDSSYEIVAQNAQGLSTPSYSASILCLPDITPIAGLTPPPGFAPTPKVTPAYPAVVWISGLSYPGVVSSYAIYRSTDTSFSSYVDIVTEPVSFISDNSAVSGYTNNYVILAKDANGVSVNPLPGTAPEASVDVWPNAPSSIVCLPSTASINLSWAVPLGNLTVTGYDIHRSTCASCPQTLLSSGITSLSYPDSIATPRIPYFYEVDTVAANGLTSVQATASGLAVAPVSLQNTPNAASNILNWSPVSKGAPSNITGYVVYRMSLPNPATLTPVPFTALSPLLEGINNTVYADINVTESVTYAYEVAPAALNPAGGYVLGPFSNVVTQLVFPQPVADLEAASGNGIVQLRWDYQGTANNKFTYTILRKLGTAPDSAYQVLKSGFSGLNFTDSSVQNKTFYDYEIVSADANGLTSTAQYVTALPAKPPIILNTSVTLSQSQGGTIQGNTLTWWAANMNGNSVTFDAANMYPLGGYLLSRSTDGGGIYSYTHIIPVPTSSGTTLNPINYFDAVQLIQGATNTYLIQAFDAPPDLPVPMAQAVTQDWVHLSTYNLVTAYLLNAGAALTRNAIRPFGNLRKRENVVDIRFVVTTPGNVNIKVYSLNGTFIKELVNRWFTSGVYGLPDSPYPLTWDAKNMNGTLVSSGVYLITVEMNGHQEIDKVAVIK